MQKRQLKNIYVKIPACTGMVTYSMMKRIACGYMKYFLFKQSERMLNIAEEKAFILLSFKESFTMQSSNRLTINWADRGKTEKGGVDLHPRPGLTGLLETCINMLICHSENLK